ncbi:MAG: CHAP domain-containing protein [Alphaproteobacteria bacterium]|nr:CHAP domain-containing protein [Alphaproteobacteria bacterium]MBL6940401.1 CHAP domain-containing protein [Alphaproteobacteria bacterium]MBL7099768.1 CHAP domain-containing protein [Alphaproteobacteria bacterium]
MNADTVLRIAGAVGLCVSLGACSTGGDMTFPSPGSYPTYNTARGTTPSSPLVDPNLYPDDDAATAPAVAPAGLQCVPYAREHSAVNIHGDAYTWWDKAAGLYARGSTPLTGSVMVLVGYAGRHRAHVAVVTRLVSPRLIRINHANWNDDGAIYVNDPVQDVSASNDWSQVKVWNIRTGSWGTKAYTVRGFIGPGPEGSENAVVAFNAFSRAASDPIGRQIALTSSVDLPPRLQPAADHGAAQDDALLNDPGEDR